MEQEHSLSNHLPEARPLRVGLLGCGTVGTEVARLLLDPGVPGLELERVAVRDLRKQRSLTLPTGHLTADALAIVKDPQIDVVVELIGGVAPSLSLLRQALAEGKHVVTANKILLALHGNVLRDAARERSLTFLYEGAAGGALPVVRTLRSLSSVDRVRSLSGVLNGTTNFILAAMEKGIPPDVAVSQAQTAGYAEADPNEDIEGIDAACKLSLLCSLAFGRDVPLGDIARQGIGDVSTEQVRSARSRGLRVKLVATAQRRSDDSVVAHVAPIALSLSHPLAGLEGTGNGVLLDTECSGHLSLFGEGAGGRPTAASVLADLEDIARRHGVVARSTHLSSGRRSL